MVTEYINQNNRYYKKYLEYMEKTFNNFRKKPVLKIFEALVTEGAERITKDNAIDCKKLFSETDSFVRKNQKRFTNDLILKTDYAWQIIDIYLLYKKQESIEKNPDMINEKYEFFNNIPVKEYNNKIQSLSDTKRNYEHDENPINIIPNENYSFKHLIKNFSRNKNMVHKYNHLIPEGFDRSSVELQRARFRKLLEYDETTIPINYEIDCPICQRKLVVNDFDFNASLRCTFNEIIPGMSEQSIQEIVRRGHPIKKGSRMVKIAKTIYGYNLERIAPDGTIHDVPQMVYSFEKLKEETFQANFLFYLKESTNGLINDNILFILGTDDFDIEETIPYNIIQRTTNSDNKFFLADIFNSCLKYLQKEHDVIIQPKNQIIAYYVIFQLLMNLFHKQRTAFFMLGKSGTSKTFWSQILPRLFTPYFKSLDGVNVSKNVFLGGTSHKKSIFGTEQTVKGAVSNQDYVILEESSNSLDDFNFRRKINNCFYFIKVSSKAFLDVTTRGTSNYETRASLYLTGNLEHLSWTQTYQHRIARAYRELSKKEFNYSAPLFHPLDYYKDILQNYELGTAHYSIRTSDAMCVNRNPITLLPDAEMARFHFFIVIEDSYDTVQDIGDFFNVNKNFTCKIHREQILKELGLKFSRFDINALSEKKTPELIRFKEQVYRYLKDEFFNSRQNYRKSVTEDVNAHVKEGLLNVVFSFFLFQKQFYSESLQLTDDDKKLFQYFISFNYNVITQEQASLKAPPLINDYSSYDDGIIRQKLKRTTALSATDETDETDESNDPFADMNQFNDPKNE